MLIRGATVLSMDPTVGDLPRGDVLIDGTRIVAVGPNLTEAAAGETIDASGCLVMPGFVDTHRHMWEGGLRGIVPRALWRAISTRCCLRLGPGSPRLTSRSARP